MKRTCLKCGKDKLLAKFPLAQPENPNNNERIMTCKICNRSAAHRDEWISYQVEHRPDWLAEQIIRERNRPPEHIRRREYSKRRARRMREAQPPWANVGKILNLYREARRLTEKTGIEHAVDHIIPLQNDIVCGLHVETNLRVITKRENAIKHNKFDESLLDTSPINMAHHLPGSDDCA